ncbi:centrosome-associated protein 350-like, partial [Chiloscyllium plagiosum]|uniref:centrosome-associated protein 350-like n=1 Tax=Chiloscyllium plagiosum TaxID=36176 RepID=UPI001CB8747F
MKPSRMSPSFFKRARNPQNLNEVKEQYQKTGWQKMKTFGRRKRDRVDDILSYDEFMTKTQAEPSKDLDVGSSSSTKLQIQTLYSTDTEKLMIKPCSLQSSSTFSEDQRPDGK